MSAVQADQTQIQSAIASIDRIATQTQFGTKRLLDGTSGIIATVIDTTDVAGIYLGGTFGGLPTQSGQITVSVQTTADRALAYHSSGATYASVTSLISSVNGTTTGAGGTVVINGQSITVAGSDTVQTLINKINNLASVTGVSAFFSGANGSGTVVLRQQNYGANFKIVEAESATVLFGATHATSVAGTNAVALVQGQVLSNNVVTKITTTFTGGQASSDSGLRLTDQYGNSILLTEAGNSTKTRTVGSVTASALQFQIGSNAGQYVSIGLGNVQSVNLGATVVAGKTLKTIDVTTAAGASDAMKVVDEAISQISVLRAEMGSFQQNTLASTVNYLGIGVENLSASESQIRDTNVAQEVTKLTKNQILQQAGTSVLAQANSAPQLVLKLLQG
jgi:flagellin